jgi:hypothetical protein
MRARLGIFEMVGLAATLIFAIPVALFGLERVATGDTVLGVGLLVVAALMVLLPRRLTTPQDVPGEIAGRVVGRAVKTDDDEESQ